MDKIFFSTRVTESFFTPQEIAKIQNELKCFQSKSEFIRKVIKFYLANQNQDIVNNFELKELINENQLLLKELKKGGYHIEPMDISEIYRGEEQSVKTDKVLNLL